MCVSIRWRETANVMKLRQMRAKMAFKEMNQFRRQMFYNDWISFVEFKHSEPLCRGRAGSITKIQAQEYARQKVEVDPASREAQQTNEIKDLKAQLAEMGALIKSLQEGQNNNMADLEGENQRLRQQLMESQSIVQRFQSIHRKHAPDERVDQNTLEERVTGAVSPGRAARSQASPGRGSGNTDAILRRLGGRSVTPPNQVSAARRAKAQQMKEAKDVKSPGARSRGRSASPGSRASSQREKLGFGSSSGRGLGRPETYDAELDEQLLNSNDAVDDMTVEHMGLDSRKKSLLEHSAQKWADSSGTSLRKGEKYSVH